MVMATNVLTNRQTMQRQFGQFGALEISLLKQTSHSHLKSKGSQNLCSSYHHRLYLNVILA